MNQQPITKEEAKARYNFDFPCDVYVLPEGTYIGRYRLARDAMIATDGSNAWAMTKYGWVKQKCSLFEDKGCYSLRGYFITGYGDKTVNKWITLSRLMATVMGLNIHNKIVSHKNGEPLDNRPENLEVVGRGSKRKWW